jgi:hypothetical protein
MTDDPDFHLVVDGRRQEAVTPLSGVHVFHLTAAPATLRLVSRAAAPQGLGQAREPRVLGVAIRRVVAIQETRRLVIEADDASLTDSFHSYETESASAMGFRWTDGYSALPPALFAGFEGPFDLEVHLAATARYIAGRGVHRAA